MSRDKILKKLTKLYAHMESAQQVGNQAEAEAFAAKAQELLDRHELTMSDVEYSRIQEEDPMRQVYTKGKKRTRVAWSETLSRLVADAHHCRVLVIPGSDAVMFVGRGTHTETAAWVFESLVTFAERQSSKDYDKRYWEVYKATGSGRGARGYRAAWLNGFNAAIAHRYKEQKEALRREAEAAGNGMALIRLDNATRAVDTYMKESMRTSRAAVVNGRYSNNEAGRKDGFRAGTSANLNANGLRSNGSGPKGLLG